MPIPNYIRAWIMMVPIGPSILVAIFNLYHLLTNRVLRTAINNHVIILLLCIGLFETVTDILWQTHFYRTGISPVRTSVFCFVWSYFGSGIYTSVFVLMAWASIERHIIIFNPNWFGTKIKACLFHYLPLSICILWPLTYYFTIFFILPCNVTIYYNRRFCNVYFTCTSAGPGGGYIDSIGNFMLPAFVTIVFSVALLIRVVYIRHRVRGRVDWKKYRKLSLQLLPISGLYMVIQLPPMVLYAAYTGGLNRTILSDWYGDGLFFTYWLIMITPFVTVLSLPDKKTKCRKLFWFCQRNNVVVPTFLARSRSKARQAAVRVGNIQ